MALTATAAVLGSSTGCVSDVDLCHPDEGIPAPGVCDDPDAGDGGDASDSGDAAVDAPIPACAGQCLPLPPHPWSYPDLVWIGPEFHAPTCPDAAPALGYAGHAGLNAPPLVCGACQCDPPTGSCGLPAMLTASSTACPGTDPAAVHTPFDPPTGWDGGCTSNDAVPAGQLCNGSPCVASLTIAPLVMNETGCKPTQLLVPKDSSASWSVFALACRGEPFGACANNGLFCAPQATPGFRVCIYQKGDNACPADGPYTEKHVFYDGLQDMRTCSPCTCGPPDGSACLAKVSIFEDAACATAPSYVETIDSSKAACHDLISGAALGSKSATAPMYAPGACAPSGGEPMGSADPDGPSTLCCIPSPSP